MKKLILLCSIAFTFSCTNDNEIKTSETSDVITSATAARPLPPISNATDQMFYDYVTSDIYTEVRQLISFFNENLYVNDSFEDFETEDEMFSWISGNIELTNFQSVSEAKSRWTNIKEKLDIEVNTFLLVYEFIRTSPRDTVLTYINKWETPMVSLGNNYCQDAFRVCSAAAAGKFAGESAISVDPKTGMPDIGKQAAAVLKFVKNATICMNDFKKCARIN